MELIKVISVFFLACFKFLFGITGGYLAEWNIFFTMFITAAAMMTSVVVFSYIGNWFRNRVLSKFYNRKRIFSKKNRQRVRIWNKYGMFGVAFFTPILLMPIGGTLIATGFGCPRKKLFLYMGISAILWSMVQTWLFYNFYDQLIVIFG